MENQFVKVTVEGKEQLVNKNHIVRIYASDKNTAVLVLSHTEGSPELYTEDDYEFFINSMEE
ncbi:MAG: hypothetical protein JWO58_2024 [Chitinophagaceae bacterium]|nr:hypothetical protein [Chitinophagaceae bacterium]